MKWIKPMQAALGQAQCAADHNEVPVGAAVLNKDGHTLAMAYNQTLACNDPTAHAEIYALRKAARSIGNHRLTGCVLVVTLEPCMMCLGAIIQARIAGVVFAARDPKAGALLSQINVNDLNWLNHRFWIVEGICREESQSLLTAFFSNRRNSIPSPTAPEAGSKFRRGTEVAVTGSTRNRLAL